MKNYIYDCRNKYEQNKSDNLENIDEEVGDIFSRCDDNQNKICKVENKEAMIQQNKYVYPTINVNDVSKKKDNDYEIEKKKYDCNWSIKNTRYNNDKKSKSDKNMFRILCKKYTKAIIHKPRYLILGLIIGCLMSMVMFFSIYNNFFQKCDRKYNSENRNDSGCTYSGLFSKYLSENNYLKINIEKSENVIIKSSNKIGENVDDFLKNYKKEKTASLLFYIDKNNTDIPENNNLLNYETLKDIFFLIEYFKQIKIKGNKTWKDICKRFDIPLNGSKCFVLGLFTFHEIQAGFYDSENNLEKYFDSIIKKDQKSIMRYFSNCIKFIPHFLYYPHIFNKKSINLNHIMLDLGKNIEALLFVFNFDEMIDEDLLLNEWFHELNKIVEIVNSGKLKDLVINNPDNTSFLYKLEINNKLNIESEIIDKKKWKIAVVNNKILEENETMSIISGFKSNYLFIILSYFFIIYYINSFTSNMNIKQKNKIIIIMSIYALSLFSFSTSFFLHILFGLYILKIYLLNYFLVFFLSFIFCCINIFYYEKEEKKKNGEITKFVQKLSNKNTSEECCKINTNKYYFRASYKSLILVSKIVLVLIIIYLIGLTCSYKIVNKFSANSLINLITLFFFYALFFNNVFLMMIYKREININIDKDKHIEGSQNSSNNIPRVIGNHISELASPRANNNSNNFVISNIRENPSNKSEVVENTINEFYKNNDKIATIKYAQNYNNENIENCPKLNENSNSVYPSNLVSDCNRSDYKMNENKKENMVEKVEEKIMQIYESLYIKKIIGIVVFCSLLFISLFLYMIIKHDIIFDPYKYIHKDSRLNMFFSIFEKKANYILEPGYIVLPSYNNFDYELEENRDKIINLIEKLKDEGCINEPIISWVHGFKLSQNICGNISPLDKQYNLENYVKQCNNIVTQKKNKKMHFEDLKNIFCQNKEDLCTNFYKLIYFWMNMKDDEIYDSQFVRIKTDFQNNMNKLLPQFYTITPHLFYENFIVMDPSHNITSSRIGFFLHNYPTNQDKNIQLLKKIEKIVKNSNIKDVYFYSDTYVLYNQALNFYQEYKSILILYILLILLLIYLFNIMSIIIIFKFWLCTILSGLYFIHCFYINTDSIGIILLILGSAISMSHYLYSTLFFKEVIIKNKSFKLQMWKSLPYFIFLALYQISFRFNDYVSNVFRFLILNHLFWFLFYCLIIFFMQKTHKNRERCRCIGQS
ncbi:conserved Plasmodium protein, unknown function [Plasmodium berghei]|uniref:Uncharacterized protein n=2 Tax=Plasmodium berghei TaxID=5821 RepID=A0A509API6_PLABA|nr:conserved Plasmodium protein, unknown function [Plasmodium berghei ANKA]CXI89868.1 conserved Plasmodium protein, unknown function [Plasmodium berghei]SCL96144.1 conserved Plasmodium protein, unknown function [Plasmodium berghei]SCM16372.1 conserved Plasmodium protein, unknown function [Plasmodium berghei]SCM18166.1 conserved Plasmodium protein, unknown function [Plasmodium berghei]SCN27593.1 conserved Plasmodium protein, unknown function [Plasmodium berghei]|eukprot:XP_034423249.1 conserved Plasmodium protein, unknown function [Plasmodium berghei ANKA]